MLPQAFHGCHRIVTEQRDGSIVMRYRFGSDTVATILVCIGGLVASAVLALFLGGALTG